MSDTYDLDLNLLKALRLLIQHQHVGRAAETLGLTQPAMSHALRKLRDHFRDPLLVRSGNRMLRTPRAETLAVHLDRLFAEISQMSATRELAPEDLEGPFRIATHDFIATQHLAPALQKIATQSPKLRFHIDTFAVSDYDRLAKDQIDLVLSAGLRAKGAFIQKVIAEEPLVCLLAANHPALQDWSTARVFDYPHMVLGLLNRREDPVEAYARRHRSLKRSIGMVTGSLHTQPALLERTEMIAFLPKSLAVTAAHERTLVWKSSPFHLPSVPICMIWTERSQHDDRHRWVRQTLESLTPRRERGL